MLGTGHLVQLYKYSSYWVPGIGVPGTGDQVPGPMYPVVCTRYQVGVRGYPYGIHLCYPGAKEAFDGG